MKHTDSKGYTMKVVTKSMEGYSEFESSNKEYIIELSKKDFDNIYNKAEDNRYCARKY